MHDIRAIRDNPNAFVAAMRRRGIDDIEERLFSICQLDVELRRAKTAVQESLTRKKALSREIGEKRRAGEDTSALEAAASALDAEAALNSQKADHHEPLLHELLSALPNVLDLIVPDGTGEDNNVLTRVWRGGASPTFPAKQHFELGEALGMMDFENAARMSGSRFTILSGALARLERALGQYMLDSQIADGFREVSVPLLVKPAAVFGTGQLPKFADDLFRTTDDRYLIPTAEVSLTNMVADQIIREDALPMRLTALTECFRAESGSGGRDVRGMLRQHQFRKVEMVSIATPEQSDTEHALMVASAERILANLGLSFRRMFLCAGDTGFASSETFDLEVWLPGQQAWREISSISNCRDFQARRMMARYKGGDGKAKGFVHTLNGSGLAVGRTLIAVMETYQQEDGSIAVPEVLRPYMGGMDVISRA